MTTSMQSIFILPSVYFLRIDFESGVTVLNGIKKLQLSINMCLEISFQKILLY